MFKAFTDNISSFIGGSTEKTDTQSASENEVSESASAPATSSQEVIAASQTNTGDASEHSSSDAEGRRSSKVPPPRPNPPVAASASISKEDDDKISDSPEQNHPVESSSSVSDQNTGESTETTQTEDAKKADRMEDKLEEVAGKAKEWGSYLFSITKSAGASVGAKAMEFKKVVADNTIIGDFVKEQDKFVSAKKEKARANEAAVPPWVGYNEEEQMRTQMIALSNDRRNFLRNPPTGVQFHFDYDTCYPVAMATLAEDDRLKEMRFKLVPKLVTEHDFWRNYFYRVSLIKQSTQLTSLAKQSTSSSTNHDSSAQPGHTSSQADGSAEKDKTADVSESTPTADINDAGNDDAAGNDEFISDAYNLEISDEDLMKEMEALRASPSGDDEWEEELQKELTDFEMVGSGEMDDAALEDEIMSEMNKTDLK